MSKYIELKNILGQGAIELKTESGRVALCPELGGRVFAELCDTSLHRIDPENVKDRSRDFNNYGGLNFWPAPEGGRFGFNYDGDTWVVQPAINVEPFRLAQSGAIEKKTTLINRATTKIDVVMTRKLSLGSMPDVLSGWNLSGSLSYKTIDSIEVTNDVTVDEGLISSWSLEQFDATSGTISFAVVNDPENAINFDFYDHPGARIAYRPKGFTYRTDGQAAGQIGIKLGSKTSLIGFFDAESGIVCIRENLSDRNGIYFNIADNDQSEGPYSAADDYSIFNSAAELSFFELETIAPMKVEGGLIKGSELISTTTFALFESPADAERFVTGFIE